MTPLKSPHLESIGVLLVLAYVTLSSVKDIVLEKLLSISNPADYLAIVFGITTIIYGAISAKRPKTLEQRFTKNAVLPSMLALNVVTLGNWFGLYYSLKYLSAPAVSVLYAGTIPAATMIVNGLVRGIVPPRHEVACAAGLFSIALYWFAENLSTSAYQNISLGLMFLTGSAATIAATTVISKKLSELRVPTATVMAHRFYLLLCAAFLLSSPLSILTSVVVDNFVIILFVAVGGTVLSLWALQKGIEKTDPMTTNLVISAGPVVTLAIYPILSGASNLATSTYIAAAAVTVISMFNAFYRARTRVLLKND